MSVGSRGVRAAELGTNVASANALGDSRASDGLVECAARKPLLLVRRAVAVDPHMTRARSTHDDRTTTRSGVPHGRDSHGGEVGLAGCGGGLERATWPRPARAGASTGPVTIGP